MDPMYIKMEDHTIITIVILIVLALMIAVTCCITYYADSLIFDVNSTIHYTQVNQDDTL